MAKRKKYPRLPSGFGQIRYLGKKRRNPYGVYPPAILIQGKYITPKALCYVDTWIKGLAVLTAYKSGTYISGVECKLDIGNNTDDIAQFLLANYNKLANIETHSKSEQLPTFSDVYKEFYFYKYEREGCRKYANSTKNSTRIAYQNCEALHNHIFADLKHDNLQGVIDKSKLGHAGLEHIIGLFHQIYEYAMAQDIVEKGMDYSSAVKINIEDNEEHGEPFSEKDLKVLWKNKDNELAEMILIMCYSGYRISAYKNMEVDLKKKYFDGGVKSKGVTRQVPIHSAILPLVKKRLKRDGFLLKETNYFRLDMYETLQVLGIEKHTPHDTRHTFSMLCEKYEVKENDRKRMLGHKFKDVTNNVYGHRTVEDLRKEIEKIPHLL